MLCFQGVHTHMIICKIVQTAQSLAQKTHMPSLPMFDINAEYVHDGPRQMYAAAVVLRGNPGKQRGIHVGDVYDLCRITPR